MGAAKRMTIPIRPNEPTEESQPTRGERAAEAALKAAGAAAEAKMKQRAESPESTGGSVRIRTLHIWFPNPVFRASALPVNPPAPARQAGKAGKMARVVRGGTVRPGDPIELIGVADTHAHAVTGQHAN